MNLGKLRYDALKAVVAGIRAVRADLLVERALDPISFSDAKRIYGISVGKASAAMHAGLISRVSPEQWAGGIVVTLAPERITNAYNEFGSHPIPSELSQHAATSIISMLRNAQLTKDDLVICCISGGTSAMLAAPIPGLTITDLAEASQQLLLSGIDVTLFNAVRQYLSSIHGGGLAVLCAPARCLGLILCDNVQVGISMVGSGPTFPHGPLHVAEDVIERYLQPPDFRNRILAAIRSFPRCTCSDVDNLLIGGPDDALAAATYWAKSHGYDTHVVGPNVQGEARIVARELVNLARNANGTYCILAAGEVTVTVKNTKGRGGRCQELAWAVADELSGMQAAFVAIGTDGCDHIPGVAGAWVDGTTAKQIAADGFDWNKILVENNTYLPLRQLKQLIHSQGTGINVCDLYVLCGVNPIKDT